MRNPKPALAPAEADKLVGALEQVTLAQAELTRIVRELTVGPKRPELDVMRGGKS